MSLSEPLIFEPLYMERVWGGRRLERLGRRLPPGERIGESWELVDREDAQSVVHDGPLRGLTLHELWTSRREEIFGAGLPDTARFPLLLKILDAQDRLSVQVHPPPEVAVQLGGEPKAEMWYFLDAMAEAEIYAGLKAGVTRESFEQALRETRVAELVHRVPVRGGDAISIPSGRVHAIGAGNLIIEVQQNSDTTYRVFDWNRVGLDGRPRKLHIEESLQSIDFNDTEPQALELTETVPFETDFFRVEKWRLEEARVSSGAEFAIFAVTAGSVQCDGRRFQCGDFFLVPAAAAACELVPAEPATALLRITLP